MFCDEVKVNFIAGAGGKGCVAFRREKYVPLGGPYGGDGGKGGSIFLEADVNINTLAEFNTMKHVRAKLGDPGYGKEQAGLDAEDLIIKVPLGTMVFDENKKHLVADLHAAGDRICVARGGRGGYGNAHFKTSIRQAPTFAELGEPGEEKILFLELKLVADVGIIGLPSVGKSTLISRISNARPKIAAYHFTTLVPNLGLVTLRQWGGSASQNFLACDLPGLIEDAHKGKGLGIQFLKHVARNRVLTHLLDVTSADPVHDYRVIRAEMRKFDKNLAKKPELIVFNKIDAISEAELEKIIKIFKKKMPKIKKIYAISCVTGTGVKELVFGIWKVLGETAKEAPPRVEATEYKVFKPLQEPDSHSFTVKKLKTEGKKRVFEVQGPRIGQIAVMTDFTNPEAMARIYDVLEKMHINKELRRAGAKFGDEVKIGKHTLLYRWE